MQNKSHSHCIKFDELRRSLDVFRILDNKQEVYLSSISYSDMRVLGFDFTSRSIGELILLDSPAARDIFDLNP
jgi:hypothetical protein